MNDEADISRLEQLVEDSIELAEENNKLLKSLVRTTRLAFWSKAFLWVVILILPFIFLGPFLKTLIPASDTSRVGGSLFGFPSVQEVTQLLDTYRTSTTTQ